MAIKVRVRDFQSIEDGEIAIDGLTVLTGTNNAGKSAFFRAVRGAFTNARGSDFVRVGKSHCIVDITFEDGQTLTWEKGSKVNRYVINGKAYDRVGHGVPPEVAAFGVTPITVGNNNDLWPQIAPQVVGVTFLLDQPGSVVAEAVADVERVNQLNHALKSCDSDKRSAKSELKLRNKDRKDLEEKLEVYVGLDAVVSKIDALEVERDKAQKVAKAILNLEKLGDRYRRGKAAVEALEGLEEAGKALPTEEVLQEAQDASQELEEARDLGTRYEAARAAVEALEGLEDTIEKLPTADQVEYVEKFRKALQITVGLAMRYEAVRQERDTALAAQEAIDAIELDPELIQKGEKYKKALANLRTLKSRFQDANEEVRKLELAIEQLVEKAQQAEEEATEILGTYEECPTCGSGLDHGFHLHIRFRR
jgi:tetratricopeptide (TPR) repeat protein